MSYECADYGADSPFAVFNKNVLEPAPHGTPETEVILAKPYEIDALASRIHGLYTLYAATKQAIRIREYREGLQGALEVDETLTMQLSDRTMEFTREQPAPVDDEAAEVADSHTYRTTISISVRNNGGILCRAFELKESGYDSDVDSVEPQQASGLDVLRPGLSGGEPIHHTDVADIAAGIQEFDVEFTRQLIERANSRPFSLIRPAVDVLSSVR